MERRTLNHTLRALWSGLLLAGSVVLAQAHPLGNMAICHYTRLEVGKENVQVRYILDLAELPTFAERAILDRDGNGAISDAEQSAYLEKKAPELAAGLRLSADGKPLELTLEGSRMRRLPGAAGLDTMQLFLDLRAKTPQNAAPTAMLYIDSNYAERAGWKEIVAVGAAGIVLQNSSVPTADQSKELSAYPKEAIPPQIIQATFSFVPGVGGGAAAQSVVSATQSVAANTPQDAFTQIIAQRDLTPGLMLVGLGVAFVFGAFHALSPGHGKAMVAAYLVGSRGTAKHAAILGLTVTITHTFGVFLLGFVTLVASRYIVTEKLLNVMSLISGAMVCGVGGWLLWNRWRGAEDHHHHHHHHDHDPIHPHDHSHDHGHSHSHHSHDHDHEHSHDHPHDHSHHHDHDYEHSHSHHDHNHSHEHRPTHGHSHSHHDQDHVHHHDHHSHDHSHHHHDHEHGHSHGFGHHHHHHVPEGPITLRGLIALGISGGIVPCPSALVVLLAAIALHRVAYGMLLITAFSAGLAAVLVAIGLAVVLAGNWLEKLPHSGVWTRRLPTMSAVCITLVGLVLVLRAAAMF